MFHPLVLATNRDISRVFFSIEEYLGRHAQAETRDLTALVNAGLFIATGEKRGRAYTAAPALIDILREVRLGRAWKGVNPFG